MSYCSREEFIKNTNLTLCSICGSIWGNEEICMECKYQDYIGNMEIRKKIKDLYRLRKIQLDVKIRIERTKEEQRYVKN